MASAILIPLSLCVLLDLGPMRSVVHAQEGADAVDGERLLEPSEVTPSAYWLVGVSTVRTGGTIAGGGLLRDQLLGLSAGHRWDWFEVDFQLMSGMNYHSGFEDVRSLVAITTRVAFDLLGLQWTYGVSFAFETRLDDHFWLAFLVPAELGLVVFDRGSWHVRVLTGPRILVAGELINSFIIDPNGIDNEEAVADLRDAKGRRLSGFIGVAFTREID